MNRRPPRSTLSSSSAASDVYKRQGINAEYGMSQSASKRYIVGALFLIIGSLWTLDNIGVFDIRLPWYFTEWYSIMILIGIFVATMREKVGLGLTFVAIGAAFLIRDVYYLDFRDIFDFWPVIFIIIGGSLLFRRGMDKDCLLYTSPSPRDRTRSRMPSSA
eukprot:TRINITY_DN5203_c0_g1_i1.p1 TRINITY_DN5203_c0_g1~~TRINITY_DN5203_c0_g1_i1.p1  ORF type:complete len:161 (-),score=10.48 TRINITY_DN5203_c0_g1_i1:49-531(-)